MDFLNLLIAVLLILANAFFVAAEFSLVTVRRTRVQELVAQGNQAAHWVQRAIRDPDRFIAATQLGITLASLGLGWVGEPALAHLIQPVVALFPAALAEEVSHGLSAGLAFAVITFCHVVVGELAPKSIALEDPERTALFVARPTAWVVRAFRPMIWLLNGAGNLLLRAFRFRGVPPRQSDLSVEELRILVSASADCGVVGADEGDMLHAVLDFGNTLVRQVMIPRTEMVGIPAETMLDEIVGFVVRHPYTRFPVYEGDLDHVLGAVHLCDIMRARHGGRSSTTNARGLMRETIFIPETASVRSLLHRFRVHRHHLAMVVDEYGGTAGMVTLADLLEEIVGEVNDEFDTSRSIQALPDGSFLVDGLMLIDQVNEHFRLELKDPSYETIAGFVLGGLGRLAKVGDVVNADGVCLRVEALDDKRIARLSLIHLPGPGADTPGT